MLTCVNSEALCEQFEDFDIVVSKAELTLEKFEFTRDSIDLKVRDSASLGKLGASLLRLNHFEFNHLQGVSQAYPLESEVPRYLECDDVAY